MANIQLLRDSLKWFLVSFALVALSIFFSYYIFPSQASILTISFLVIALTPHFYNLLDREECCVAHREKPFLQRYDDIIIAMVAISIAVFLSFSFWYNVLPSDPGYKSVCSTSMPCREAVFSLQLESVSHARTVGTMLGVMALCFALSLFLGAGAILIIVWDLSSLVAQSTPGHISFLAYLPQLLGFFLTGLSGALLSFAIMKHEWRSHAFFIVLKDSLALLGISVLLVAVPYFLYSPL